MNYSMIDLPDLGLLSEEETRYNIGLARQGNNNALTKVVEHNLRLVLKVTYRFKNSGYELQDLFQIGVIGLIKAVHGFDLKRENRFSTYAVSKIIGEIRLHLRDDGLIKISRSLKKIVREVRKREEELKKELNHLPSIKRLAEETGYSSEEIIRALEANKKPASIYQTIHQDEGTDLYLIDSLEEKPTETDFSNFDRLELVEVLKNLDDRSRRIIYLRYFQDKTQQEIAEEIGVSQVQVSRLEKKILRDLKNSLN